MTEQTLPPNQEPPNQEEVVEDFKDKYVRTLAEMENMRKRLQKEKQEMLRFGVDQIVTEFLPAIDGLENALAFADQASNEVKSWATGFKMLLAQFKDVLQANDIAAFHAEGHLFDPVYHEAVETQETTEHPPGIILKEFSKGYKSRERILRPARVCVAKQPKLTTETEEEKSHEQQ